VTTNLWTTAFDHVQCHRGRIFAPWNVDAVVAPPSPIEVLQRELDSSFFDGLGAVFHRGVMDVLRKLEMTDATAAVLMGVSRPNVSKMRSNQSMIIKRLAALWYSIESVFDCLPTRGQAAFWGFARATTTCRQLLEPEERDSCGELTPCDFAILLGILASDTAWNEVLRQKVEHARAICRSIVQTAHAALPRALMSEVDGALMDRLVSARPEQLVLYCIELVDAWGDAAAITLASINQRIPLSSGGKP
jgi:hypothetical protein